MPSATRDSHEPPTKTATPAEQSAVVVKHLVDTHALVNHGLGAVRRQQKNLEGDAAAQSIVQPVIARLEAQANELEARVKALGGSASQPLKDALTTVTGFAAGVYGALRTEEAARAVRDDYTFLSHLGISYLMLHTTASSLEDPASATIAAKGYAEVAAMVMDIDRLVPGLVLAALRDDGLHPKDTCAATHEMVRAAWARGA